MRNARVKGSFKASGGSGNDIRPLIMDDMAYTNWSNKHQVNVLYSSGQLTVADIDVPITTSARYHLVLSNDFSTVSSKNVTTKIDLIWSELRYQ